VGVACLPKSAEFFPNVRVDESKWLGDANSIGTSILIDDERKPIPSTEGLFIPGVSECSKMPEASADVAEGSEEESGCYLVYDEDASKLIAHYSKAKVPGAIGFFTPGSGQKIPGFKFKNNQGRNDLMDCSSGRKSFYDGCCQFIRIAKAMDGSLSIYPSADGEPGLPFNGANNVAVMFAIVCFRK